MSSANNIQTIESTGTQRSAVEPRSGDASSLEAQLRDAKAKIERLQDQVTSTGSQGKLPASQVTAHNQGVPVPITALIALIAFMAAYLLF